MIPSNPFETLSLYLLALEQAIRDPSAEHHLPLVPTPFGGIHYQQSYLGKFWNVCNLTWQQVFPQDLYKRLQQTISHALTDLFNEAVSQAYDARQFRIHDHVWQLNGALEKNPKFIGLFKQQHQAYETYLKEELKDSVESPDPYLKDFGQKVRELNENEKAASRHLILHFFQSTDFFWPFVMKKQTGRPPFKALIQPFLQGTHKICLLDRPLFKALKKESSWVQLEGILQQPIPVTCLAKINNPLFLTVKERETLKNWVKALNHCQRQVTPRQLFHVLSEVMSLLRIQGSSSLTLEDVLIWLDREECSLLYQEDGSHMDWRESLKPGSKIKCNGKELILGEQLSPQKETGKKDQYKIFALQGHPDKVVKIACNRFLLLLDTAKAKDANSHWGIRFLEINKDFGLDQRGRCVVLERLQPLFKGSNWQSNTVELMKNEERFALIFVNHLDFLHQTRTSLCSLSVSHLMWDAEGKLKSTRLLKKGEANYKSWEMFCLKIANGNEFILSFLIQVSNLHKDKMSLYYRDVITEILKTGQIALIGKALPLEYRHQEELEAVEKIAKEAQQLRQDCLDAIISRLRIETKYSQADKEEVEEKAVSSLIKVYAASSTAAHFSPSFKQQVIDHYFSSSFSPTTNAEAQAYYRKQREILNQYNQGTSSPST